MENIQEAAATLQRAKELFIDLKMNCAEAVLLALAEHYGIQNPLIPQMATPFGGGMNQRELCGALTGALMAVGMLHGRSIGGSNEKAHFFADRLFTRMQTQYGTTQCKAFTGVSKGNAPAQEQFNAAGGRTSICLKLVHEMIMAVIEEVDCAAV